MSSMLPEPCGAELLSASRSGSELQQRHRQQQRQRRLGGAGRQAGSFPLPALPPLVSLRPEYDPHEEGLQTSPLIHHPLQADPH